jgi:thiol-disulfide isomerase/thioredoxin
MKNITAAVLLLCSAGFPALAAGTSLLTEPPPATAALGETVTFRAKAGYHFNLKAPQECGASEAFDVTKASLKCRFDAAGDQDVSLKICDDQETSCMFEDFTVKVLGEAKKTAPAPAPAAAASESLEGFITGDPAGALALAKKEGRLLFIDFSARWCPPCRVMEDTVLWRPEFLAATADMVRAGLDVDKPEAREWRKRFGVTGYPTYLVADADLNEIGRWTGNASLPAFDAWIAEQKRWKDVPVAVAEAGAAKLDEAGRMRLARQYVTLEKWKEARAVLAGLNTRAAAYLDAQAQVKEEKSTDTVKLAALYRGLIDRFDGHDGQPAEASVLDWIAALYKADHKAAKQYMDGINGLISSLNSSTDAAAEGYGPEDILYGAATAMDDADRGDLAAPLYVRAAAVYGGLADKALRPELAKGLRLSQARCLVSAGKDEAAAAVYAGLVRKFPAEYAFHRSYANVLSRLNKYPEAISEVSLAEKLSYGDIHSQIVMLKARIQAKSGDKSGAAATLRAAIAAAEVPGSSDAASGGMKKYLKELESAK